MDSGDDPHLLELSFHQPEKKKKKSYNNVTVPLQASIFIITCNKIAS